MNEKPLFRQGNIFSATVSTVINRSPAILSDIAENASCLKCVIINNQDTSPSFVERDNLCDATTLET